VAARTYSRTKKRCHGPIFIRPRPAARPAQLCKNEASTLEQAQTHIRGQRATVLGVTYEDNPAASRRFVRARHITYPVLRDVNGRFVRSFKGNAVPETFVIDQRGRIVAARDGEISRRWLTRTLARVLPG
jgi:cytochrome c biogenesis protein CcmG/thiol:disulfide interchange protein DsbE